MERKKRQGEEESKMASWIRLQPHCLGIIQSASFPRRRLSQPFRCLPPESQGDDGAVILCEDCNGKGWLLCDFCKGQKTNVKSESNRIYRRCPSCRAVGCVLCNKCKVFKCVTFPNPEDGQELLLF